MTSTAGAQAHLKREYQNPGPATDPDDDLLLRAIFSVTEAVNQGTQNRAFGLYRIDGWMDIQTRNGVGPTRNRRPLVPERPLLLPWKFGGRILLVHVHLEDSEDGSGQQTKLDLYSFHREDMSNEDKRNVEDAVEKFLVDLGWFGADPRPGIDPQWYYALLNDQTVQRLMVIFSAWALALDLDLASAPEKISKKDRDYASSVIQDAANGTAAPPDLLAILFKCRVVSNRFSKKWQSSFANTVDLRDDNAFNAHWTSAESASNQVAQNGNGGPPVPIGTQGGTNQDGTTPNNQQIQSCKGCNVADHCPGASGADRVCIDCKMPDHCATGCSCCPITSHCIPNITNEAVQGLSYHKSIHAFRPRMLGAKRTVHEANPDASTQFIIKCKRLLCHNRAIMAITAVTEAISLNGRGKIFSLYSSQVYDNAVQLAGSLRPLDPLDDSNYRFEVVRQRCDLIFPMFQSSGDHGHIWLAVVKNCTHDNKEDYEVDVYDSSFRGQTVTEWTQDHVKKFIREARWWSRDPSEQIPDGRWNVRPAAQQGDDWSCGFHTVLNAWAVALGLELNMTPYLRRKDYAIEAITHASWGEIDCKTICQLLHLLDWVKPGNVPAHDRQFGLTKRFGVDIALIGHHENMWRRDRDGIDNSPQYQDDFNDCTGCLVQSHCLGADGNPLTYLPALHVVDADLPSNLSDLLHRIDSSSKKTSSKRKRTYGVDETYLRQMQKRFLGREMRQRTSMHRSAKRLLEQETKSLRRSKRRRV